MEIERKFLVKDIDNIDLLKYHSKHIVQDYLYSDLLTTIRKRAITENNKTIYTYTIKTGKKGLSVNEIENEITKEQYDKIPLIPLNKKIVKTRYLIPYIDDLKQYCLTNFGALCHITIARDDRTDGIDVLSNLRYDEYKKVWNQFESEMFKFKTDIFYQKRNEFCYAGDWSLYVNLETGRINQCYCGKTIGNLYDFSKPIPFEAIGKKCSLPHCYNGHAFLTIGDIPEINSVTYDLTRNRICLDGSEWLQPEMKEVMQTRLSETNKQYSAIKKHSINKAGKKDRLTIKKVKRKIRKIIK